MQTTTFTTIIHSSCRSRDLRRVFVSFPYVAPPGVAWDAPHGGRHFEMTSYCGGAVELYLRNAEGIYMYQGSVRDYAPGAELAQAFRAAWYAEQPSKAARDAFEKSATTYSSELFPTNHPAPRSHGHQ